MNYYKITVQVKTADDDVLTFNSYRNYAKDSDVFIYSVGFADGCAQALFGSVLEKQIEKLNDDRSFGGGGAA